MEVSQREVDQKLSLDPEFQSWVKGLLHDDNIRNLCITFTKADGTERGMFCTLVESTIPTDKVPKGTGREPSTETQRVFDTEKQQWRSFRWESVKAVSFSMGDD